MWVEACSVQELKCITRKEHKCISERRTESATNLRRETRMQVEKRSVEE
jgi:hypothetical protein